MKIALVGNQNSGKTSLFNVLTGMNQTVGNWPGVTIEHKEGIIKGTEHKIIDLPGIYSLSPYTTEEEISRKFAMEENPDLIINIVDATSIERSLYLTTQLMELNCNLIVALNMCDLLSKKGLEVNEKKLSKYLGGIEVVKVSAKKNTGIDELIDTINTISKNKISKKIYDTTLQNNIDKITSSLNCNHKEFVAVKLLEKDKSFEKYIVDENLVNQCIKEVENFYNCDTEQIIANQRYEFITSFKNDVVTKLNTKESITDKIDKIILNKYLAIPIFVCVMAVVYLLAVGVVGSATVNLIDDGVTNFSDWFGNVLSSWGASPWAVSLVCDGIISGVGSVLNFVPQLIILFICVALLETCGYMSRIAFFFDKIFKKFGLSGKSLIPFIVGSGCSVPGIMTTRIIEDENEKQTTILLTPFIPCSAKLPIISCFAGAFFGNSWLVTFSLYIFAICVILISAILVRKFIYKTNQSNTFISELPEYKLPSIKYIAKDTFDKTIAFIKRAGTIILLCSVVIWIMLSFNWKFQYGVNVEDSILASIGNCFAWVFYPMLGEWSWGATVSAIQGLVAKEQVVSSMSIIAGFSEEVAGAEIFSSGLFSFFNSASAYAYMVFNLFSAPCFGAIGAMHREFGSAKKTLIAVGFQTGIAWLLSVIVFAVGSLILMI